jgi:hypothetical protein
MSAPDLSHEACEKRLEIERVAHLMDRSRHLLEHVLEPLLRDLEGAGVKLEVGRTSGSTTERPSYEIRLDHPNYRLHSFVYPA